MRILSIETSCDETSASVIEKKDNDPLVKVLSVSLSTSIKLHATTGGIIPEQAAREQVKFIIPVIVDALVKAEKQPEESYDKQFNKSQKILKSKIDSIAVTIGPGLIGSLLVGVETAKTIAFAMNKPIIPVNHLLGHIYANFLDLSIPNSQFPTFNFPFIALIVSGNHTDLLLFRSHQIFEWLGGTRDDAAGEAFDKIGRMVGLSYPAGAEIEKRANKVKLSRFSFKSPMLHTDNFDFSFSGLKTEVLREVKKLENIDEETKNEICFSTQKAVIDVLVVKTLKAAKKYNVQTILLGGGVSANQSLRDKFQLDARRFLLDAHIFAPAKMYCTDNAAMIGAYAAFHPEPLDWRKIQANPELYFD